ncbi:PerC family transcriptional regulator, partial [Escherichia coli]|nr:PerC family transcriptional regulator [Escherichia coli]EHY9876690.1 PerC family transcriptional regulator [Escherichia coli]ELW5409873.1 PerC family transcriptional regulator [Escherichia coli]
MTHTVTIFRSEGVTMVHDRIAEELEEKGFYRRA